MAFERWNGISFRFKTLLMQLGADEMENMWGILDNIYLVGQMALLLTTLLIAFGQSIGAAQQ